MTLVSECSTLLVWIIGLDFNLRIRADSSGLRNL